MHLLHKSEAACPGGRKRLENEAKETVWLKFVEVGFVKFQGSNLGRSPNSGDRVQAVP